MRVQSSGRISGRGKCAGGAQKVRRALAQSAQGLSSSARRVCRRTAGQRRVRRGLRKCAGGAQNARNPLAQGAQGVRSSAPDVCRRAVERRSSTARNGGGAAAEAALGGVGLGRAVFDGAADEAVAAQADVSNVRIRVQSYGPIRERGGHVLVAHFVIHEVDVVRVPSMRMPTSPFSGLPLSTRTLPSIRLELALAGSRSCRKYIPCARLRANRLFAITLCVSLCPTEKPLSPFSGLSLPSTTLFRTRQKRKMPSDRADHVAELPSRPVSIAILIFFLYSAGVIPYAVRNSFVK